VAFLKHDETGCEIGQQAGSSAARGYYKILKEVSNRFALLNYGCLSDPGALQGNYDIVAMKLGDGWALLSPTNNFNGSTPSCLMVDTFKISKTLTPKCFENTGYNNGALKDVVYQ
jgi:hypothetical protein